MQVFEELTLDFERALYGLSNAVVKNCTFEGEADGESALKEGRELNILNCTFALRYPMWHVSDALLQGCVTTASCRAPLWYGKRLTLQGCSINGMKAIRECDGVTLDACGVQSEEFAWKTAHMTVRDSLVAGKYAFLECRHLTLNNVEFEGRYAFQYVEEAELDFCTLRTKDAFWHSKNVTIRDSILEGEYLGWYSENLTLDHCVIVGRQPLAYCKGLTLIDCRMEGADLAFERSEVEATIRGTIDSVKNPLKGHITADSIGEVISDMQAASGSSCEVFVRE